MILKSFNYFLPKSVNAAGELLKKLDEAVILGGGTFYLSQVKKSGRAAKNIIGLKKAAGLNCIKKEKNSLYIGSMATLDDIARDPLVLELFPPLPESINNIVSVQIRNMATIGGNICSCLPWVDLPYILLALDAMLDFGDAKIAMSEFLKSPKVCLKKRILRGVIIPVQKINKFILIRIPRTNATDIPLCAVCFVETDKGIALTANIGNSYALRFKATENFLQKGRECKLKDAVKAFNQELAFQKDAYRKEMLTVCFKRVLEQYGRA